MTCFSKHVRKFQFNHSSIHYTRVKAKGGVILSPVIEIQFKWSSLIIVPGWWWGRTSHPWRPVRWTIRSSKRTTHTGRGWSPPWWRSWWSCKIEQTKRELVLREETVFFMEINDFFLARITADFLYTRKSNSELIRIFWD